MVKRKNVFTEKKKQKEMDEFTGLKIPRGIKFESLPPAIVDGKFIAKKHDKIAFAYPIELGRTYECVGTVCDVQENGAVYIWNETMGNRTYSFKLPEALSWVCDIRLLEDAVPAEPRKKRRSREEKEDDAELARRLEAEKAVFGHFPDVDMDEVMSPDMKLPDGFFSDDIDGETTEENGGMNAEGKRI